MTPPELRLRALAGIPEIAASADLAGLLAASCPEDLAASDLLVVAHKIVSKAEGRVRELTSITPGDQALALAVQQDRDPRHVQAILDETAELVRAQNGVLICRTHSGLICANAGVDLSNVAEGQVLALPTDPDESARRLRAGLAERLGLAPAVLISDSFGRAWRIGQVDVAIGASGLEPLDDWRGRHDRAGRELAATAIAVADAAAAAADLVRAKDAGAPAVLISGLGRFVTAEDGPGAAALRRPAAEDLFL